MYMAGRGVKQDDVQAVALYRKTCDGGEALGCLGLASMYRMGRGVRQDDAEALKYFGRVCDLKSKVGCDAYAQLKMGKQ
jgi:TPR repeat protein